MERNTVGLVMEGGGMRGMFTAGVLDVMMEHHIRVDGAIGVSAGAVFGCNYKSGQIGRAIRYNKRFCNDRRFAGFGSWIRTGDLYSKSFAYGEVPQHLDPFDTLAFAKDPMPFYVVATDAKTGSAVYHNCKTGDAEDIEWMRASASIPLASRAVRIGEWELFDGGVADPIPIAKFREIGYKNNIVILTREEQYIKKEIRGKFFLSIFLRKYPALIRQIENRHKIYNQTLAALEKYERDGNVLILRPPQAVRPKLLERDPEVLDTIYRLGRQEAEKNIESIHKFIKKSRDSSF